jgi:hypothetical protein
MHLPQPPVERSLNRCIVERMKKFAHANSVCVRGNFEPNRLY